MCGRIDRRMMATSSRGRPGLLPNQGAARLDRLGWWLRFQERRRATDNHYRLLAAYDLHQLVYAFAIILAVAAIYVGILMVRADVSGGRRLAPSHDNGVLGGILAVVGAVVIVLVAMATVGPWREHTPPAFPVHIMDLQQPISQAERQALKHPAS
jgi:hypothetical protein